MASLADAFIRLRPSLDGFKGEADKGLAGAGLAQVGQKHGQVLAGGFTSGFGSIIKSATGLIGVLGAAGIAGAALKMGIQTAASLEQAQIGFATLLGSGQKAQTFLKKLSDFAASTPFELPGLIETSRMLIGAGVSADQAIPKLRAWGDAAGAVGISQDAFKRTMIQVTQAISAGVIRTGDLNIIAENGIPVWKLLAESTGKTVPELRKLAEQGKLLSKDVLPALEAQMTKDYGGAMARQSQTLAGVWSTLKDTVSIGLATSLQPLVPILTQLLPKGADLVSRALAVVTGVLAMVIPQIRDLAGWFQLGFIDGAAGASGLAGVMQILGAAVRGVWDWMRTTGVPTAKELFAVLAGGVGVLVNVVTWFNNHRTVAVALLGTMGALVAVTKLHAAVLAVEAAGGLIRYIAQVNIVQVVTKAWAAVQWVLNAALTANPIGIVIVAIAALVAGVIYAWTHFSGFRDFLIGAWHVIADTALWLWHNVLEPMWKGISAVVLWAWNNIIWPAFQAFDAVMRNVIAPTIMWLWHNVIQPAWQAISIVFQIAWAIIKPIFELIAAILRNVVAPTILWFWHNVIEPAWKGLSAAISFVWNNVIKPVFDAITWVITHVVAPAFAAGVEAIRTAWDKVREAAKTPINFVIGFINAGIIRPFNTIAGFFGVKDRVGEIAKLAGGGMIRGPGGPRDDKIPALLSNQEFVVNAAATSQWLPVLEFINSSGRRGRGPQVKYPGDGSQGVQAFADGGLVGWLSSVGSGIMDFISNPGKAISAAANRLLTGIPGGGTLVSIIAGMGHRLIDALITWVKGTAGAGGGAAASFLAAQVGKGYGWAQAGPNLYDCSGIISAVFNVLHGRNPYSHTFSTSNEAGYFPIHGFGGALTAGWSNPGETGPGGGPNGVGHTAGVLMIPGGPIPFESTGSRGVHIGSGVTPLSSFAHVGHYDRGGMLPPGASIAVNNTGRPEPVGGPLELSDRTIAKLGRAIGRELRGVGRSAAQEARGY